MVGLPEPLMLDPIEAYVRAAALLENGHEEPPGSNDGMWLHLIQACTGNGKGDPWCMSACCRVGRAMFGDLWPLPRTGSTNEMGRFAARHGILFGLTLAVVRAIASVPAFGDIWTTRGVAVPERGDILLYWSASKGRFHHAAIVREPPGPDHRFRVWAGNTIRENAAGDEREGWGFFGRHARDTDSLAIVRWITLMQGG